MESVGTTLVGWAQGDAIVEKLRVGEIVARSAAGSASQSWDDLFCRILGTQGTRQADRSEIAPSRQPSRSFFVEGLGPFSARQYDLAVQASRQRRMGRWAQNRIEVRKLTA